MANRNEFNRWLAVVFFAAAMAWVEAAAVLYLRVMLNRIIPYQPNPLPVSVGLGQVELVREAATLVMLLTVGWLAGGTWRSRLAYSMIAFGAWDIFYYIFLVPMSGWPKSLLDWDVLFLLPLPWWGPVLAPVLVSVLLIVGGTLIAQFDRPERPLWPGRLTRWLNLVGVILALYIFMADTIRVAGAGEEAVRNVLPTWFNWPLFIVALLLMAAPVADLSWQIWGGKLDRMQSAGIA
ncbi:MAG: hypothetical protein HYZ49_17485 [Chloroflexi bacterium]|nr:hypothetical protein [Chloroflexota bacterium]